MSNTIRFSFLILSPEANANPKTATKKSSRLVKAAALDGGSSLVRVRTAVQDRRFRRTEVYHNAPRFARSRVIGESNLVALIAANVGQQPAPRRDLTLGVN